MEDNHLIRIVRMTLKPECVSDFLRVLEEVAPKVRATPGCLHLELWKDRRYPNIMTTYSRWESAEALNAYRAGDLFAENWSVAREMFAAPPFAASHSVILRASE